MRPKGIVSVSWWRWALLVTSLAAIIYVAVTENVVTFILVVAAIAAAVFAVWNPFKARPHPRLLIRAEGSVAGSTVAINTDLRPVDVEAVVGNARDLALSLGTNSMSWMTGFAQKPTEDDFAKYRSEIDAYLVELREWVESASDYLRLRASVIEAVFVQENESDVDAEDARSTALFPPGTELVEAEELEPPVEPERPKIKTRPSPLASAMMSRATRPFSAYSRPTLTFSPTEVESFSLWEPDLVETESGHLEISYRRQNVRHRETEPSGDSFMVRIPAGSHKVKWKVTARNLPHPATGSWTITCSDSASGKPIRSLGSLQAAIAGEPEFNVKGLFASASEQDEKS